MRHALRSALLGTSINRGMPKTRRVEWRRHMPVFRQGSLRRLAALLHTIYLFCCCSTATYALSYTHALSPNQTSAMFASSISLLLLALLFRSVEAGIRFNVPNGNTTWDATKPQYIKWRESGSADNRTTLEQLGSLSITLWAGSNTGGKSQVATVGCTCSNCLPELTLCSQLGTVAATAKELQVNLPLSAGADGGVYFIQAASTALASNIYDSSK